MTAKLNVNRHATKRARRTHPASMAFDAWFWNDDGRHGRHRIVDKQSDASLMKGLKLGRAAVAEIEHRGPCAATHGDTKRVHAQIEAEIDRRICGPRGFDETNNDGVFVPGDVVTCADIDGGKVDCLYISDVVHDGSRLAIVRVNVRRSGMLTVTLASLTLKR